MTVRPQLRISLATLVVGLPLLVSGCETPQQVVQNKEDRLVAAGFVARPADTPKRVAMLRTLPSHKFEMRQINGHYVYLYSDPLVCGCLYVGSEAAYGQYKQMMFQQNLANQQEMTAQLYSDPGWSFDGWGGPFGPGFGGGFGPGFY